MKFIQSISIFLIFTFATLSRAELITYKPANYNESKGYFVAKGEYEDLRVSSSSDSKIKYWSVQNGNLKVEQYFDRGILQVVRVRQFQEKTVNEIILRKSGNSLKVISALSRLQESYYGSSLFSSDAVKKKLCESRSSMLKEVADLKGKMDGEILQTNLEDKIIHPTCKSQMSQNEFSAFVDSLVVTMQPKNKVVECLKRDFTAETIAARKAGSNLNSIKEDLDLLLTKYLLETGKFAQQPDSLKGKISCEKNSTNNSLARTQENRSIVFLPSKETKSTPIEKEKLAAHEMLHSTGVVDEKTVEGIIKICYAGATRNDFPANYFGGTGFGGFNTVAQETHSSRKSAAKTEVRITDALAKTPVPETPAAELNKPFVNADADIKSFNQNPEVASAKALSESRESTIPVLNWANKAVQMFVPTAEATTLALRAPASFGSPAVGGNSGSAVLASGRSVNSAGDPSDYEVQEEILVGGSDKQLVEPRQKAQETDKKVPSQSYAKGGYTPNANGDAGSATISDQGSSSSSSVAGATRSVSGATGRGGGSIRSIASVNPKAKSVSTSASTSSLNGDQLSTIIKSDYQQTKEMIVRKDKEFIRALETNKIKILDMKGNEIGAKQGAKSIFLEKEGRFVLQ